MKYSKKLGRFGFILIAILGLTEIVTYAQTATPSPTPEPSPTQTLEHEFFKNILRDQKAIWLSPFHLGSRDVRWVAPLGIGTAVFIATDRHTSDEIAESSDQLKASQVVSYVGSGYGTASIAAAFYVFGRTKNDARARETGILGAEALLDGAIVGTVLKEITQRARPSAGKSRGDFFDGGSSFPSGHSMAAWSLATVVANEYSDHRAVQIGAYALASAVSISRYTGHNHFISDVLVGSAMGYGIGRYVYRTHHRKVLDSTTGGEARAPSKLWPMIAPDYDRKSKLYGVGLAWNF
jgi:membrane-associated phospholipid phosphatase